MEICFFKWGISIEPKHNLRGKHSTTIGSFTVGVWNWFMLGKMLKTNSIQLGFLSVWRNK